jgi:hypothetical protein
MRNEEKSVSVLVDPSLIAALNDEEFCRCTRNLLQRSHRPFQDDDRVRLGTKVMFEATRIHMDRHVHHIV